MKKRNPDYSGSHEAPTKGDASAPLHNVTGLYPDDIYGPMAARYYGHYGDHRDNEAIAVIQRYRNHANRQITVYRAVPSSVKGAGINRGDWVTTVRAYAKEHGEAALNGEYRIIKKMVYARDLFTDANSIYEFGYDPQPFDKDSELALRERRAAKKALQSNPPVAVYPMASRDEWYGDADYERRGAKIVWMPPAEYLKRVRPLKMDEASRDNVDSLIAHIIAGRTLDPLAIYPDGKEDGRHRATAAIELGIASVPVLVFPRKA